MGKKYFFLFRDKWKKKSCTDIFLIYPWKDEIFSFQEEISWKISFGFTRKKKQHSSHLPLKAYVAHHPLAVITWRIPLK